MGAALPDMDPLSGWERGPWWARPFLRRGTLTLACAAGGGKPWLGVAHLDRSLKSGGGFAPGRQQELGPGWMKAESRVTHHVRANMGKEGALLMWWWDVQSLKLGTSEGASGEWLKYGLLLGSTGM